MEITPDKPPPKHPLEVDDNFLILINAIETKAIDLATTLHETDRKKLEILEKISTMKSHGSNWFYSKTDKEEKDIFYEITKLLITCHHPTILCNVHRFLCTMERDQCKIQLNDILDKFQTESTRYVHEAAVTSHGNVKNDFHSSIKPDYSKDHHDMGTGKRGPTGSSGVTGGVPPRQIPIIYKWECTSSIPDYKFLFDGIYKAIPLTSTTPKKSLSCISIREDTRLTPEKLTLYLSKIPSLTSDIVLLLFGHKSSDSFVMFNGQSISDVFKDRGVENFHHMFIGLQTRHISQSVAEFIENEKETKAQFMSLCKKF